MHALLAAGAAVRLTCAALTHSKTASQPRLLVYRLPLNATSVQLVGQPGGEPEGRAANLIQLFGGGVTVKLSSAAVPDDKSNDTILIGPPFYLEVALSPL